MEYYVCQCGYECNDEEREFDYKQNKYVCPKCHSEMFEDHIKEEQMQVLAKTVDSLKELAYEIQMGIDKESPYVYGYEVSLQKILNELEGIY